MTRIIFVQVDGTQRDVDATDGQSVMQAAVNDLVPGIIAECGGELSCATCHVRVDEAWLDKLPPRSNSETDMLDATSEEPTHASRLACQIAITPFLNGLVVHVPRSQ